MPLTAKGEKVLAEMKEQYGDEKGTQVFYASINKGKLKGTHKGKKSKHIKKAAEGAIVTNLQGGGEVAPTGAPPTGAPQGPRTPPMIAIVGPSGEVAPMTVMLGGQPTPVYAVIGSPEQAGVPMPGPGSPAPTEMKSGGVVLRPNSPHDHIRAALLEDDKER